MRGKLLRLRQLKDLVGTLNEVSSCQGVVELETIDVLQGNKDDIKEQAWKSLHFD